MEDKTYNGYKNYETWNVALWIDNDETLQAIVNETANNYINEPSCNKLTGNDNTVYSFAKYLENLVDENMPTMENSMYLDSLTNALKDVDYMELAELYLQNAKSEAE